MNESGVITDDVNLLVKDMVNMYPTMPREYSEQGVREFVEKKPRVEGQPTADSVIEMTRLCSKNNYFEFMGQIYCQLHGSAIGQKHSQPVACLGEAIAERKFLNSHRYVSLGGHEIGFPERSGTFLF